MPFHLPAGATVVFQGDSVTATSRGTGPADELGNGYVKLSADLLRERHPHSRARFLNRGVGGDRVADLRARWDEDTLAHRPDLVSVMVGINETWRRYDAGDPTPVAAYEADYRYLLTRLRAELGGTRLVLMEPFLVPVEAGQWSWREDLDPRIHVVRRLAEEFDAALLAADGLLNQAARAAGGPEKVAGDGIHPTPLGHEVLARAWSELVVLA